MGLILNIETSSKTCSVALAQDGRLLSLEEEKDIVSHATKLTPFIKQVFFNSGKELSDLDAIAISIGPGSYTGLRIGLSSVKGLCYTLNKPLIAINTLQILASTLVDKFKNKESLYIPFIDARREDVYFAVYNVDLECIKEPEISTIKEDFLTKYQKKLIAGGNCIGKVKNITNNSNFVLEELDFSAVNMIGLSYKMIEIKQFEDIAYIEPNYMKPFTGK